MLWDNSTMDLAIQDPSDYFSGVGHAPLPIPKNILLFLRTTRQMLQQEALQNRSHHRFVLTFNLETEGHVHANNRELPFCPGQALLILPYQFHHFSRLASPDIKWLFCTFELDQQSFLEPLRNRVLDIGQPTRAARDALVEEWLKGERDGWKAELQEMELQSLLLSLLLCLKQDLSESATDLPPEPRDSLLRTVNRLMSEWRGRSVGVADVAEALSISEPRLRARFKASAGIPLGRYLQNYRLNRAMALLRTTDLPIAEVAEEAGFGSPQAFSRVFKQKTGTSPRAYRRGP